jgi:hypothetical protein
MRDRAAENSAVLTRNLFCIEERKCREYERSLTMVMVKERRDGGEKDRATKSQSDVSFLRSQRSEGSSRGFQSTVVCRPQGRLIVAWIALEKEQEKKRKERERQHKDTLYRAEERVSLFVLQSGVSEPLSSRVRMLLAMG